MSNVDKDKRDRKRLSQNLEAAVKLFETRTDEARNAMLALPRDVGLELIGLLRDLLGNPRIKENVYHAAFGGAVSPDYPPNIRAAIAELATFYRQILYSKYETEKELGARLGIRRYCFSNFGRV